MGGPDLLGGLATDAAALAALLGSLPGDAFDRPTPCAAWDVRHLIAHLYRDFERVPEALSAVTADVPDTDWLSYWSYDRGTNQAQTQDRAARIAGRFHTAEALVGGFCELLDGALGIARGVSSDPSPSILLPWGGVISFDDLLRTRWVELVVHSIDLTDALGRHVVASVDGVQAVVDTLDGLAGVPLSRLAPWAGGDPVDYVRAGTGRRALATAEEAAMGRTVSAGFPLLA